MVRQTASNASSSCKRDGCIAKTTIQPEADKARTTVNVRTVKSGMSCNYATNQILAVPSYFISREKKDYLNLRTPKPSWMRAKSVMISPSGAIWHGI
jgi:hypothetical protein